MSWGMEPKEGTKNWRSALVPPTPLLLLKYKFVLKLTQKLYVRPRSTREVTEIFHIRLTKIHLKFVHLVPQPYKYEIDYFSSVQQAAFCSLIKSRSFKFIEFNPSSKSPLQSAISTINLPSLPTPYFPTTPPSRLTSEHAQMCSKRIRMLYRMPENFGHPVVAATGALRFADHVTKGNGELWGREWWPTNPYFLFVPLWPTGALWTRQDVWAFRDIFCISPLSKPNDFSLQFGFKNRIFAFINGLSEPLYVVGNG